MNEELKITAMMDAVHDAERVVHKITSLANFEPCVLEKLQEAMRLLHETKNSINVACERATGAACPMEARPALYVSRLECIYGAGLAVIFARNAKEAIRLLAPRVHEYVVGGGVRGEDGDDEPYIRDEDGDLCDADGYTLQSGEWTHPEPLIEPCEPDVVMIVKYRE